MSNWAYIKPFNVEEYKVANLLEFSLPLTFVRIWSSEESKKNLRSWNCKVLWLQYLCGEAKGNSPSLEMIVLNDFIKSHNSTPGEIHSLRYTNVDSFTFDYTVEKCGAWWACFESFYHTFLLLHYCNQTLGTHF